MPNVLFNAIFWVLMGELLVFVPPNVMTHVICYNMHQTEGLRYTWDPAEKAGLVQPSILNALLRNFSKSSFTNKKEQLN